MEESSRSELDPPSEARTWGAGKATLPEQFEHYDSIDFAVISDLAENITDNYLAKFSDCFEPPKASFSAYKWHFITKNGYEKLRTDCPGVWLKFFPNVRA